MKKIVNDPKNVVSEMIEGYLAAYGGYYRRIPNIPGIILREKRDGVAVVIGGGSGCEPLFLGFVGQGLADGVAIGNVFAAPSAYTIYEVTKQVHTGEGVLYIAGNHPGDFLNFDMAVELMVLEGVDARLILSYDNIASAPPEAIQERRGMAGVVFVIKIAGGAASSGLNLTEATRITEKAARATRSLSVITAPGYMPNGEPMFMMDDGMLEIGMGFNGEPGIYRADISKADEITDLMLEYLIKDANLKENDEICVLVNGLGAISMMEMLIAYRRIKEILDSRGIIVHDSDINKYFTPQEMGGFSITILVLDDELKKYYDMPAYSPDYHKCLCENTI